MWRKIINCLLFTIVTATYRLSNKILPLHYDLSIAYHINTMEELSYFGVVRIKSCSLARKYPPFRSRRGRAAWWSMLCRVDLSQHAHSHQLLVNDNTDQIELHVNNPAMIIGLVTVSYTNGSNIGLIGIEGIKTSQILRVILSQFLMKSNNYTLTIPYEGKLVSSNTNGVYISSYMDESSQERESVIYSHFEPTSARSAFPCFDEPHMKAEFTIKLAHNRSYHALSNMRLKSQSDNELMAPYWTWDKMEKKIGHEYLRKSMWIWSEFETSKPMPTYLVAWVISKFASITDHVSKVDLGLWARRSHITQGRYALSVATKLIPFFENIFIVPFPLSKLDIVALPDFKPVAMENWGLAAFHESTIIYGTTEPTTLVEQNQIVELIAHELAHQWFGALVTMEWWSDVWLNEGFATLMVYLAKNYLDPSGNTYDTYIALGMRTMLEIDELRFSHQVSSEIDDPTDMNQVFDSLSYLKSALIINMMRRFLGNEVFTIGIHRYFLKYSYKSARQDQLWDEISAAANETSILPDNVTLKEIMNSWSTHPGFPLLTVTRDYNANSVFLSCKRFKVLPNRTATDNVWWIPMVILSQLNSRTYTKSVAWLGPKNVLRQKSIRIDFAATPSDWVLFNMDMIAPMRIKYDEKNWNLLTNTLMDPEQFTNIPVLSRTQLLSDSFTLAKVFSIPYKIPLRMVMYLQHEIKYAPLETGLKYLWDIRWRMLRDADYKEYLKFMRQLLSPIYEQAHKSDARQRVLAIDYACRAHLKDCEDMAISLFSKWISSKNPDINNPIEPVLRSVIYCAAVRDGGVKFWDFLNQRRVYTSSVTEVDNIIRALACTEDRRLLSRYLNMTLEKNSTISEQDLFTVLEETLRSPVGYKIAHDFFLERTKEVVVAFKPHGVMLLGDIVNDLLAWYNSDSELRVFQEWCYNHAEIVEFNKPRVQEAVDLAILNIRSYEKNKDVIALITSLKFQERKPTQDLEKAVVRSTGATISSCSTCHVLNIVCVQSFFLYLS